MAYREMKHNNMQVVIDNAVRSPGTAGEDLFNVSLSVSNPAGPPGSVRRGPFIALRDGSGRQYEPVGGTEVAVPVAPGTTVSGSIDFELDEGSEEIQMVLAPDSEDEVVIELPDIPRGSR